jgi:arylsulfate sulfotransferase
MTRLGASSFPPLSMLLSIVCLAACTSSVRESTLAGCTADAASIQGAVSATQNPQVARYSVASSCKAKVMVEFGPDTNYGLQTAASRQNTVLVAGMRAFTTYHMRARLDFDDGSHLLDSDHTFTTGGLPPDRIPNVTVTRPGLSSNPGIEILDAVALDAVTQTDKANVTVFDLDGNLIWFYDLTDGNQLDSAFPIKMLPSGNFLLVVIGAFNGVREINLAGETISQFSLDDVNRALAKAGLQTEIASLHHDILALSNGHLILLANTNKMITEFSNSANAENVLGDVLIDLDEQRKPVWVWSAFEHLDTVRHPFGLPDWTHANAVIYSPNDGDLILSMRNQNWVIKIDYRDGRGDGAVLWRLGPQGDFVISGGGPADFNYAQHYPVLIGPKTSGVFPLMLFDNGNGRSVDSAGKQCDSPAAIPCYSRPVIFELDEAFRTAKIEWQYKLPIFSPCCGNVNILQNGNVEFDTISFDPLSSRIQEVTETSDPQLVWQMDLRGQLAYRGFRLPSLYPGVEWGSMSVSTRGIN